MEITVTFPGGKRVDAEMGGQVVRTDQPAAAGGEGAAPSPFSYCLASLATCAGFYVLSYLQARGLPLEGVRLTQRHETDPRTHRVTRVTIAISLPPAIPEKHHGPIVRAAETCAVKRLIEQPPEFDVRVEASAG